MSNSGLVFYNNILAGRLERRAEGYVFTYDQSYLNDISMPPVALSFPRSKKEHRSPVLFPFFAGLLTEGVNKDLQCSVLKIDEDDSFTRLLKTAGENTIGAVTVREEA